MSKGVIRISVLAACFGMLSACSPIHTNGDSPKAKRDAILNMRADTLAQLYKDHPAARDDIRKSAGYAVFSDVGVNILLISAGGGEGVAHDNRTKRDIYMKMISGGVGPGLGIKDFRGVFVFHTNKAFDQFVDSGWEGTAQADAAAKSGKKGKAVAGAVTVAKDVDLYQITENGLALQATLQGTKYYKDDELNGK
jgi:lipid-binding SYLF domain-containing protein